MTGHEAIVKRIRGLLEHEPRVNLHRYPIKIDVAGDVVFLEGEVEDVAAKKLALELAAGVNGIRGIVDRLRIKPAERRGDGAIRDSLCGFFLSQPELRNCTLRVAVKGRVETLRDVRGEAAGAIDVAVENGVITLDGTVISLSHKRIVGVLAWWTPGCRDVVNSLAVVPPEDDNEEEVADALRLVLDMDPLVEADTISAQVRNYVVTLEGHVRTEAERRRAELDAWALFAVDKVINKIEVRA